MSRDAPPISLVVPTRNGGGAWRETLTAILRQQCPHSFELIVIDTASEDGTPELAERLCADPVQNPRRIPLRLIRIARHEFGHGRTRNLGARLATGKVVMFLSQDATPVGDDWLTTFLRALDDPRMVAAFCRQVAQLSARLPERFILETAYPAQSSRRTHDSLAQRSAGYILFSNAASAIRRDVLLARPFREDLMMCEDAHWAVEMLRAGHTIAYVAEAQVAHSHHYTLRSMLARNFDFAVTLQGLPGNMGARSYLRYLRREAAFVVHHGGPAAMPWMGAFEVTRCLGYTLGTRYRRLPREVCRRLSGYPSWFGDAGARWKHGPMTPVIDGTGQMSAVE
jgi:rhamnosyltransferase